MVLINIVILYVLYRYDAVNVATGCCYSFYSCYNFSCCICM